ncbi:hypothetical protein MSPP1_000954 [Malassezia sp. CBS 17886]|nr:hypothetical protein MSPP1_000954 [Malassezia sp. CBS 17886]
MSGRQHKVMVQPINVIFRHLQQQTRVSLWLYDNTEFRLEGKIIGFDEFMNVTLADAEEVRCTPDKVRKELAGAPLRPRAVSQLRTPKHSNNLTVALSISSMLDLADSHTPIWRRQSAAARLYSTSAAQPQTPDASRRAALSAAAAGAAGVAVALGLCFIRTSDPLHADAHALPSVDVDANLAWPMSCPVQISAPAWLRVSARDARRAAHTTADMVQLVKDAAQVCPL